MKAHRAAAIAALPLLAGCLATKQDLQTLQTRMDNDRAEQNRQIEALITRTQAMLDSLSSQNARMRADVANRLLQIDRQLVQIQSLSGQSQQQIRDLQRQLEQRAAEARAAAAEADSTDAAIDNPAPSRPADSGSSTRAPAGDRGTSADRPASDRPSSGSTGGTRTGASAPTTPPRTTPARPRPSGGGVSADEAYDAAMGAYRRGSMATARGAFQEFLSVAPDDDRAPDAQFYIGETYTRDPDAAIAAYQRVLERWPRSSRAPASLLRIAKLEIARGDRTQARAHLNQILRTYPRSDEADEARTQLERLGTR